MVKKQLIQFLKGILAGASIALGGFLFVIATFLLQGDLSELGKILGSLLFPVGLFLVCTFGFSLYTGKIGLVFEERKESWFYISLPVMLIGNAIGTLIVGYACYFIFKDTDVMTRAIAVANARLDFSSYANYLQCFIKSFLCGLCVYIAVKSFGKDRLKPIGILLLVFFVFVFVYCGFEHCVANMFYFSMANRRTGEAFIDLSLCILGNSLGTIPGVLLFKLIAKKEMLH